MTQEEQEIERIVAEVCANFRSDISRIMKTKGLLKEGDLTTEQQLEMMAHLNVWKRRAEVAEVALTSAHTEAAELKSRVEALEAENARLRIELEDVAEILESASRPACVDPDRHFSEQVKALGDLGGYGALMATASALWRQSLGDLAGSEFAAGPCVVTAANSVARIRQALGGVS